MDTVRHLALGCCILSTVAGIIRAFWPENSFSPVINAVLALYIVSAGLQMIRGTNWSELVKQLYELPGTAQADTQSYPEYGYAVGMSASVQAVRQVLENSEIHAAVSLENNTCCVRLFHEEDLAKAESVLAASCGELPYEIEVGGDTP